MDAPDAARPAEVEFVEYARAREHTLLRAAYLVCGDLRLAESLLEDALVRLARDWGEVRDEQPDVHVRQILYRDAVASWRRRPREDVLPTESAEAQENQGNQRNDDDEDEDDEVAQQRRDVLRALDALTPRQRAVVVLRHLEERTEGDVARILGVSVPTTTSEADEALRRLRAALPRVDLGTGGAR